MDPKFAETNGYCHSCHSWRNERGVCEFCETFEEVFGE